MSDFTTKQENLAVKTVFATRDWKALLDRFQELADELPQCQITNDTTFVSDAAKHLTGYDINAMLGDVFNQMKAVFYNENTFYKNTIEKIV